MKRIRELQKRNGAVFQCDRQNRNSRRPGDEDEMQQLPLTRVFLCARKPSQLMLNFLRKTKCVHLVCALRQQIKTSEFLKTITNKSRVQHKAESWWLIHSFRTKKRFKVDAISDSQNFPYRSVELLGHRSASRGKENTKNFLTEAAIFNKCYQCFVLFLFSLIVRLALFKSF